MKKYIKPEIRVVNVETENVICGSITGNDDIYVYPDEDTGIQKSPRPKSYSIWDEM